MATHLDQAMGKTAHISSRIDATDKKKAEAVFRKLGLTASQAITLFYRQVYLRNGLPFALELPNETTREAIEAAREGKLHTYDSIDDLKKAVAP